MLLHSARRFLKIGAKSTIYKTFQPQDLQTFTTLSGDTNPIHQTQGIVHGILLLSQFSKIAGTIMPGPGTIVYKMSNVKFNHPVYVDQELEISLRVEKILKNFVFVDGLILNMDGDTLVTSELVLVVPKEN